MSIYVGNHLQQIIVGLIDNQLENLLESHKGSFKREALSISVPAAIDRVMSKPERTGIDDLKQVFGIETSSENRKDIVIRAMGSHARVLARIRIPKRVSDSL